MRRWKEAEESLLRSLTLDASTQSNANAVACYTALEEIYRKQRRHAEAHAMRTYVQRHTRLAETIAEETPEIQPDPNQDLHDPTAGQHRQLRLAIPTRSGAVLPPSLPTPDPTPRSGPPSKFCRFCGVPSVRKWCTDCRARFRHSFISVGGRDYYVGT